MDNKPRHSFSSHIEVSQKDMPISCPQQSTPLWSMHPKVYISFENTKESTCPYCGTKYIMID